MSRSAARRVGGWSALGILERENSDDKCFSYDGNAGIMDGSGDVYNVLRFRACYDCGGYKDIAGLTP